MMKTFFATTATAALLAFSAAHAQTATDPLVEDPAADAAPTEEMAPADTMAQEPAADPMVDTDTMSADMAPVLTPVDAGSISAEELMGTNIQTPDAENIAEVDDVLVSPDGQLENVVATFGGFLGFGSNTVLLSMDEIEVMQDEGGSYVIQTTLTPEDLEGRPEYEPEN